MCHCFLSSYCTTAITKSFSTSVGANRASANTAAHCNFVVFHPQYFSCAMHIVHIIVLHTVSVVLYTIAERISLVMTFAHQAHTCVFICRTNCPIQAWVVIRFPIFVYQCAFEYEHYWPLRIPHVMIFQRVSIPGHCFLQFV